jgi:predicted PurR-regulated permease PerM
MVARVRSGEPFLIRRRPPTAPVVAAPPPGRLQSLADACLRLLVVGAAVVAALYVAAQLRLVVLPVALALVLATLLHPPTRALTDRGVPSGLAAFGVLITALLALAGAVALIVPPAAQELDDLDVTIAGGIELVQRWLSDGVLGFSGDQVATWFERAEEQVRDNAADLARGAVSGATLLVELLVGLSLAVVLLFFLLKDGERIWAWLRDLFPARHRTDVQHLGAGMWAALGGYLRGVTLVAAFDAVFIGLALVIVGVPLVVPLVLLTFVGAYIPIVGAFVAGIAAVLVALAAVGPVAAVVIALAVLVVQQIESNFFQPVVVGRSVRVHPVGILLGVTAGAVLAGVVGAIIATPVVAVCAAALRYLRFERDASVRAR